MFFINRFRLPKSCLSLFTHGQTPSTPKQLIMHVEVMLCNITSLHHYINYCSFIWGAQEQKNVSLHIFLLYRLRSHLKNLCVGFFQGFQTPEKQMKAAECFHLFLGVWNPWWNPHACFWYITSASEILKTTQLELWSMVFLSAL